MNAERAASGPLGAARLAAPLRRLATQAAGTGEGEGLAPALDALRAFIDRPSPANYLAATRCLRAAARQHKLTRLSAVAAPRRAAQHLAVIIEIARVPAELRELLERLPADARTKDRFAVIAELLTAHRLLAAHAEAAQQDLREYLGKPAPRALAAGRRRGRR